MTDRRFLLVGLTGGIATGKSTASAIFRSLGCVVIDADVLAREVVEPGEPALAEIAAEFGPVVLDPDGRLDRKALGAIVFADPERRRKLEAMTHPRIRERFQQRLDALTAEKFRGLVFFDAPVMIESGNYRNMDRMVVVVTDEATQIARLMARDGIDRDEAIRKIKSQMPLAENAVLADYVIDNSGDRATTEVEVRRVYAKLTAEVAVTSRLAGRPVPLAILFPVNMGHYRSNRADTPDVAFEALRSQVACVTFVGYHANVSGNFAFEEPRDRGLESVRELGERVLGLPCMARGVPDLLRVYDATPAGATILDRSIEIDIDGRTLKVVAVFLSKDVSPTARVAGTLSPRVSVFQWVSSRDLICLYERPAKNGSVGQVREAVVRRLKLTTGDSGISGTARAMSVVRDIVEGRLKGPQRGAPHASKA